MLVSEVLKHKGSAVVSARPEQPIRTEVRKFRTHKIGALVVIDDNEQLLGLLTERDIVNGLIAKGSAMLDLPVREIMTTHVKTCTPDDTVAQIMRTMTDQRTRHLPVVDGGHVRGLISIGDVVKARLDDIELENRVLRDMTHSRR